MRSRTARAGLLALLAAAAGAWLSLRPAVMSPAGSRPIRATLSMAEALGTASSAGYARAEAARPLAFPDDHGPHPDFRTEWWYYTGNLRATDGRHIGFELTFFRMAMAPSPRPRPSAWAATQAYLAHLAITDTRGARFHVRSLASRGALGLAGASARPFRVWIDDWEAAGEGPAGLPVRLRAGDPGVGIDLLLVPTRPAVLHGDRGLSRKGPEPGNASFYYSFTRMATQGVVRLGGQTLAVTGLAWMDREWSTAALPAGLAGWDWFGLQLDDGRDLMLYRLRRRDGTADPWSAGTLVLPDGTSRPLPSGEITVEPLASWTSPASGVRYPGRWRLTWPAAGLALEITPRLADQELDVSPRYWEGAVRVRGSDRGRPLAGDGYVELVGYTAEPGR